MKALEVFLSDLRHREITLWLDGDRLRYRAPEGSLSPEDLAELRDRKVEVIKFLQTAKQLSSTHQPSLNLVPRTDHLPLSFAQQRFWFLYQFEPDSPANNVPVVVRFRGNLNLGVLQCSFAEVVRRHEVLRSRFPMIDGQPALVIDPPFEVILPVVDLQGFLQEQRDVETHRIITKEARQPFDLEKGSLLRVTLFRLGEQEHLLLWNMPCIICDGTSSDLFYRELTTCYLAYATDKSPGLPALPVQYVDFASWQRQYLQGEILDSHLNYWKEQLNDQLTSLRLPTDYPRSAGLRTCRGDRYARMFSKTLHYDLLHLSQQLSTTLFCVLLSAFDVLLYRYSQQSDILTTFVSSGRNRVETENLIGFFSNTLILRTKLNKDLTFRELVKHVHLQNMDAYIHQELPFERLVDALSPEQRQGRSPLFQTKFTLNPPWTNGQGMASVALPDLTIESLFGYIYHGKTKYDVILVMREQDQGLGAVIDYNAELFLESTVERMMGHFQMLLETVVTDPNQLIAAMPLLTPEEHQTLANWSQTQKDLSTVFAANQSLEYDQSSEGAISQQMQTGQACVLDPNLQVVPVGVPGAVYVGGSDWNQDTIKRLNSAAPYWIADPFANDPTIRFCQTGVTARYLPNGNLELIETGDRPTHLERRSATASDSLTVSRDALEQDLTKIWEDLLGIKGIGMQDNFFDLGGQSLLAVRLFAQIEEAFGKRLPLSTLLKASTLEQLAAVLRQDDDAEAWSPLVTIQPGNGKIPLFCIHGGGFNVLIYRDLALNLGAEYPVYGLQARGLDGDDQRVSTRLEEIAADYVQQIRQIQPDGPYLLTGLSNGGNIAFEMAQQLRAQGETTELLALLDTYQPHSVKILPPFRRLLSSLLYVLRYSIPRFSRQVSGKNLHFLLTEFQRKLTPTQSEQSQALKQSPDLLLRIGQSTTTNPDNLLNTNQCDRWMDQISQYILDHSPWSFFLGDLLKDIEGSVSEALNKLEHVYGQAQKAYVPKIYPGRITLFRASESPPGFDIDPELGWKKLASEGVELQKIPGHHTSILRSPILAEKFRGYIENIQREANDVHNHQPQ